MIDENSGTKILAKIKGEDEEFYLENCPNLQWTSI